MEKTPKTVAFATLGCKLNYAETSTLARHFEQSGYQRVPFTSEADVYVINTCSVTQAADKKCRNAIRQATRKAPEAIVAVVGCYSQLKAEEIGHIDGVDIVLGTREKFKIIHYIENFHHTSEPVISACGVELVEQYDASWSVSDRTRAFLKIQDGCDYSCSYCTIPLARGKSRNQTIAETLHQAKEIAAKGIQEIVLTGVNIGDFGQSTGENFEALIHQLDTIPGIKRFRISSIEPNLLSNEIISFVASSQKFVPHFHIPLQSGCNEILGKMRRRYRRELFANRVEQILKLLPHACIGADVIAGFPGETEEQFLDTWKFLESLEISYLHAFTYSERNNTPAAGMNNKVPMPERDRRTQMLIGLSDMKRNHFYRKHLGQTRDVLFESSKKEGMMFGFTDNYIKVEFPYNKIFTNKIIKVFLQEMKPDGNVLARMEPIPS